MHLIHCMQIALENHAKMGTQIFTDTQVKSVFNIAHVHTEEATAATNSHTGHMLLRQSWPNFTATVSFRRLMILLGRGQQHAYGSLAVTHLLEDVLWQRQAQQGQPGL